VDLERAPDFVKLADAYGIPARQCVDPADVEATLRWAAETKGPALLDFRVAKETCVFPMIPSGQTIHDMVVRRPMDPADAPASTCNYTPRDTREPAPDEVVDVAR